MSITSIMSIVSIPTAHAKLRRFYLPVWLSPQISAFKTRVRETSLTLRNDMVRGNLA
jgi:hypothetical protein